MKKLALFLSLFCFCCALNVSWAEQIELKHEYIHSNTELGKILTKAQKLDSELKVVISSEKDIIDKYKKHGEKVLSPQPVEYVIEDTPQIFVLHGFSGNGADDIRGMKISKAILERFDQENKISIEIEIPETSYLPLGSTIGTSDVKYINARIFFEGLEPGMYDISCFKKTVHIECKNNTRDPAKDKITKTEIVPLKSFRLNLR